MIPGKLNINKLQPQFVVWADKKGGFQIFSISNFHFCKIQEAFNLQVKFVPIHTILKKKKNYIDASIQLPFPTFFATY